MTLPQLPREPIRPELENGQVDKEIWQPNWNCYCCHDTGIVRGLLIRLVVPDFDRNRDKPVACQRRGCEASFEYRSNPHFDKRFDYEICAELDRLSREDWKQTILNQHELAKNRAVVRAAAQGVNLRMRDRTQEEEEESQRRVEDSQAI